MAGRSPSMKRGRVKSARAAAGAAAGSAAAAAVVVVVAVAISVAIDASRVLIRHNQESVPVPGRSLFVWNRAEPLPESQRAASSSVWPARRSAPSQRTTNTDRASSA